MTHTKCESLMYLQYEQLPVLWQSKYIFWGTTPTAFFENKSFISFGHKDLLTKYDLYKFKIN